MKTSNILPELTHYQTQTNSHHCAPSHQNILSPDKKDSVYSQLPRAPLHVVIGLETWAGAPLTCRKEAGHFTSKGKILTKAHLLHWPAFIHLKTPNSLPFPHLKEFSVWGELNGSKGPVGSTDSSSDGKIGQLLTCFINKVLISHGEHTATPFLLHPSYIIYQPYLKN